MDLDTILVGTTVTGWALALFAVGSAVQSRCKAKSVIKAYSELRKIREADFIGGDRTRHPLEHLETENSDLRAHVSDLQSELARWRPARGPKGHFLKPKAGAANAG